MKNFLRILLWIFFILAALCGSVYLFAWKSPPYFVVSTQYDPQDSFIHFKEYHKYIDHARPFIIEKKNLIIFGSTHTRDPLHPEMKIIEEKWQQLKPTIALAEGRLGFLLPGFMDPVKNLGEGGKLKRLASKSRIKIYNWDLSKETLAAQLRQKFSDEQIALAQILNPYFSTVRFGKPSSPESFIKDYLKRAGYVGQKKNFTSVTDVDRVWKKYFLNEKDWRETSDESELPGYLNEMLIVNNDLRNQQLIAAAKELLNKGERVFILCGSSHAFCVSPAFK